MPMQGTSSVSAWRSTGDTLAVGAQFEASGNGSQSDDSAPDAGAVYVFTRTGGVWTQQAYLKASNAEANDQFGVAVALAGDTLAVGALGEASEARGINHAGNNNNAPGSGAAYVFTRTAGVWSQQAYVKASNAGGLFGYGVALAGDTLAVGAPFEASNATGINGDQDNNNAPLSGAVVCVHADRPGSGLSKPISKPPIPMQGTDLGEMSSLTVTPWW